MGELLLRAIAEEPAVLLREGGVIATGFDADLDELRAIGQNCDAFLLDLEARERARTGIANLRVQFNKVHGFYIEVTASGLDKVPADYQRRQTLKNAERYITPELKTFEDKALSAQDRALARGKVAVRAGAGPVADPPAPAGRTGPRAGRAGCTGSAGRACPYAELVPAGIRQPSRHRHPRRAPPCGRSAPGRNRGAAISSPTTAGLTPAPVCW